MGVGRGVAGADGGGAAKAARNGDGTGKRRGTRAFEWEGLSAVSAGAIFQSWGRRGAGEDPAARSGGGKAAADHFQHGDRSSENSTLAGDWGEYIQPGLLGWRGFEVCSDEPELLNRAREHTRERSCSGSREVAGSSSAVGRIQRPAREAVH